MPSFAFKKIYSYFILLFFTLLSLCVFFCFVVSPTTWITTLSHSLCLWLALPSLHLVRRTALCRRPRGREDVVNAFGLLSGAVRWRECAFARAARADPSGHQRRSSRVDRRLQP